jgi:parallel beta-helix repeat protein
VSGTGTTADPYVISGWSITCPTGFHAGINLNSTTRPFVIRNVSMQGCTWGIKMYRGPNGRIEKSRVQGSNHGALIDDCDDFAIEGFRVSANSSTSGTGIGLSRSSNVLVAENTITGGLVGISVDTSNGCSLYDNNLIGNTLQAKDTSGGVNAWDAGYPTGGNYWTNYMGADACGGPAQDDCTAPDGIGDTPYVLNAVTADLYPLMVPAFAEGDAGAPWVAITSPADGAVFMTEPIAVTGSASDDGSGLRRVEVRVNGGPWTMANGTSSWNASVDPAPGPNTIEARSLDHAGNVSNVASLGVTYDAPVWEAVMETSKVSYAPGEMVAMTFRLTNRSAFPVTLHFPTDCEMFFRVRSSTGALLFDARNGATCLSVLTQRTWQPNETVTYPGNWNQKNQSGLQVPFPASYDIQGYLDCSEEVPEPIATIDIGVGP